MRQQPIDDATRIVIDFPCPNDGEALRGMRVEGVCPRCHRSIALLLAQMTGRCDGDDRLSIDVPCVCCGYNLRSQPVEACCTECGTPNSRSAFRLYLSDAPVRWLVLLRLGVDLFLLAVVAAVLVPFFLSILWTLQANGIGPQWSLNPDETVMRSYYGCVITVAAIGALLMTLRDPTLVDSCQRRSRWFARVAMGTLYVTIISLIAFRQDLDESIVLAIMILGSITIGTAIWRGASKSSLLRPLSILLLALAGFAFLWLIWYAWIVPAYMDYFRLPQYTLNEDWCVLFIAVLGACSLYLGSRYLGYLVRQADRPMLASALAWLGAAAGGVLLAAMVLNLVYMQYVRQAFVVATSMTASAPVFTPPKWMALFSLVMQILQWASVGLILGAVGLLPRARTAISAALRASRERAKTPEAADKFAAGR